MVLILIQIEKTIVILQHEPIFFIPLISCLVHVVVKFDINLGNRGQTLFLSFEYNLSPNLISNSNHYMTEALLIKYAGTKISKFISMWQQLGWQNYFILAKNWSSKNSCLIKSKTAFSLKQEELNDLLSFSPFEKDKWWIFQRILKVIEQLH